MFASLDLVMSDLASRLGVLVFLRSCFSLSEMKMIIGRRDGRHASGVRMAFMLASFCLLFGCPHWLAANRLSSKIEDDVFQDSRKECSVLTTNDGHVNLDPCPDEDIGNVCSQICRVCDCFD